MPWQQNCDFFTISKFVFAKMCPPFPTLHKLPYIAPCPFHFLAGTLTTVISIKTAKIRSSFCLRQKKLRLFHFLANKWPIPRTRLLILTSYFGDLNIPIGIFESPKCDVNPQPNTRGIGPLVGRTSGNRHSVMHVLVEFFSITYNFSFICQYIFIWLISSGRETFEPVYDKRGLLT